MPEQPVVLSATSTAPAMVRHCSLPLRIAITVDPEIPVPPVLYGGIERIVDMLATELRSRGYAIGLVANPESTCEVEELFTWPRTCSGGWKNSLRNSVA